MCLVIWIQIRIRRTTPQFVQENQGSLAELALQTHFKSSKLHLCNMHSLKCKPSIIDRDVLNHSSACPNFIKICKDNLLKSGRTISTNFPQNYLDLPIYYWYDNSSQDKWEFGDTSHVDKFFRLSTCLITEVSITCDLGVVTFLNLLIKNLSQMNANLITLFFFCYSKT